MTISPIFWLISSLERAGKSIGIGGDLVHGRLQRLQVAGIALASKGDLGRGAVAVDIDRVDRVIEAAQVGLHELDAVDAVDRKLAHVDGLGELVDERVVDVFDAVQFGRERCADGVFIARAARATGQPDHSNGKRQKSSENH